MNDRRIGPLFRGGPPSEPPRRRAGVATALGRCLKASALVRPSLVLVSLVLAACGSDGGGVEQEELPNLPDLPEPWVVFVDPESDFTTADVLDADRQLFHFDAEVPALVDPTTGVRDSQWLTDGNELGPGGSFGFFMIRFGTEAGERRAYFTEVGAGTICNLELPADERLRVSPTSEVPPTE